MDDSFAGEPCGKPRVLVVDDEPNIREVLGDVLVLNGFDVWSAANGSRALRSVAACRPDIVVLDVMLPDMHGFTLAKMLRATHGEVPVLFLTARDAVGDRIAGLAAGGDDYVTKPFSLEEVVLRLQAILRRSRPRNDAGDDLLRYADLALDERSYLARRAGREIRLSPTEFRLLHYLLLNAGQVLTKEQILDRVWERTVPPESRVVDSYISYLRRKIDRDGTPLIHTIRGLGYSLREPRSR